MKVKIKCKGAGLASLDELVHFQASLKTLSEVDYQKFRTLLLELGFSEPFSVWQDESGKKNILNGHQRRLTLKRMGEEGIELPEKFPINYVDADDYTQAKRKVLSLASQFGEVTQDGLADFCEQVDFDTNDILNDFKFIEVSEILDENFSDNGELEGKPEVEFSEFIGESSNYIVLKFDNDIDWLNVQTYFNLKTVSTKRSTGKEWSKGMGRVVNGADYLKGLN